MEKDLHQLVEKLKAAAGANLKSIVLYGSAARGEFQAQHSDLNILCVLDKIDAPELAKLRDPAAWWEQKGHPAPLVFTLDELRNSADVFAIELMDIRAAHRVLLGEDVFANLDVPTHLHALQVERELRTNLTRLRQGYLRASRSDRALLDLMDGSLGSFRTLFRHALIALGEVPPDSAKGVVDRLAALLQFDALAFHDLWQVRAGKLARRELDVAATFSRYLVAISRVTEEVDRRLAARQ
jgi:predicted nucleotidyltransferase